MGSPSTRVVAFWLLLGCYLALTCCVLFRSPVLSLDELIAGLHLKMHHPGLRPWIGGYVTLGQRGPTTLAALPFVGWLAWRQRSKRPLVLLATAMVVLNVSVGVVKYAVGRVGPLHVADVDVHRILAGGDIYPSGHVSNAVVLYGVLAWMAPRLRRTAGTLAILVSFTVGLSTIYLRTHWFSDVLGGWLAGGLVLLSLPTALPYAERLADRTWDWLRLRYARWRVHGARHAARPRHQPNPALQTAAALPAASTSLQMLDGPARVGRPTRGARHLSVVRTPVPRWRRSRPGAAA